MSERHISSVAIKRVLVAYWREYRALPLYSLGAFLLPTVGTILVFFVPPLIIAKIVNIMADGGTLSLTTMGGDIALYGSLWLLGEAFWRAGMHLLIRVEKAGKGNLGKLAFTALMRQDYGFYTDNFVGSLTKKHLRLQADLKTS